jgi:glucose-6-phosphate 1-dehydrogenase
VLRAGKALGHCHREAVVRFRPSDRVASPDGPRNELRIGIEGPEDLVLSLVGSDPGGEPRPVRLSAPQPSGLPAYARVLLDLLEGGSALSVRGDAAEAAWRVMTPVLEAWEKNAVPLEEYPAGSSGPPPL